MVISRAFLSPMVRVAMMPEGEDPDTLLKKSGPGALQRAIEHGQLVRRRGAPAAVAARTCATANSLPELLFTQIARSAKLKSAIICQSLATRLMWEISAEFKLLLLCNNSSICNIKATHRFDV